jgi:hypothetical protein
MKISWIATAALVALGWTSMASAQGVAPGPVPGGLPRLPGAFPPNEDRRDNSLWHSLTHVPHALHFGETSPKVPPKVPAFEPPVPVFEPRVTPLPKFTPPVSSIRVAPVSSIRVPPAAAGAGSGLAKGLGAAAAGAAAAGAAAAAKGRKKE